MQAKGIQFIYDALDKNTKLLAEAHELGHLYVNELGIVRCEIDAMEPIDFFKLEFNNAVSHRILMQILEEEFNISNIYHIELRIKGLETYKDLSDLELETLFGLGLRLYDISQTVPGISEEIINDIINRNRAVKLSYTLANELLSEINTNISREEQIQRSINYFSILGLNTEEFIFI